MSVDSPIHFSTDLQRLDLLLHREILRLRAVYQLSLDEFRGLYISDEQVNRLIDQAFKNESATTVIEELTQRAAALRSDDRADDLPWSRLVKEFSLSPLDEDILLLAVAPELHLKYETLYAYLNNDITRKWPTCDLALRLFANAEEDSASVRSCLLPEAPLFANGLLQWHVTSSESASWLTNGFRVAPVVTHYLAGISSLDPRLSSCVEAQASEVSWQTVPVSDEQRVILRRATELIGSHQSSETRSLVVLCGRDGSGKRVAAEAMSRELALTLLRVDLEALRVASEKIEQLLPSLLLQQRLLNAALLLERAETLFDKEGKPLPESRRLVKLLAQSKRPIFIACQPNCCWPELSSDHRVIQIGFGDPDYAMRLRLWEDAVTDLAGDTNNFDLKALADRFVLTPGQIAAAVAAAHDDQLTSGAKSTLTSDSLFAAARTQSAQALGNLAVKVRLVHDWSDLVLPAATEQRVREVAAAIKHRHVVYSEWGFGARISLGHGLKAVFSGASGTGKTMTAGVIAKELGLDLYKIDLSAIVSKYIGETEKNLNAIFRAAQSSNAILFFDEADALFGKRSEVKDAHDRYANIEVAYLLQKIEEYDGVVILASNLSKNIDDAFSRRMHYVIEFPLPDDVQRERLWRGMFPAQVPLGEDVNFKFIATHFAIAGGDIRNVALDAAFLAAQNGQLVTMKQLVQALARQMLKQGRLPAPADFKQYYELIA
jgi:winged helix domain-containing protein/ATPase family protein associated with various cellular activities (AAA)